jgi:hypothetical protein
MLVSTRQTLTTTQPAAEVSHPGETLLGLHVDVPLVPILEESVQDALGHQATDRPLSHELGVALKLLKAHEPAVPLLGVAVAGDDVGNCIRWDGVQQSGVVSGEEDSEAALTSHPLNVGEERLCPARVNAVVDLLDHYHGAGRDGQEGRCDGQDAEGAVREQGRLAGSRSASKSFMELDHDLATGSLDVRNVANVLLRKRADEPEDFRFLLHFARQVVQDSRESGAVPLELLLLNEAVFPHAPRIWIQEKDRGEDGGQCIVFRDGLRVLQSGVPHHLKHVRRYLGFSPVQWEGLTLS